VIRLAATTSGTYWLRSPAKPGSSREPSSYLGVTLQLQHGYDTWNGRPIRRRLPGRGTPASKALGSTTGSCPVRAATGSSQRIGYQCPRHAAASDQRLGQQRASRAHDDHPWKHDQLEWDRSESSSLWPSLTADGTPAPNPGRLAGLVDQSEKVGAAVVERTTRRLSLRGRRLASILGRPCRTAR
jgi:hypothetical protein